MIVKVTPQHEVAYVELTALVRKHVAAGMTPLEVLAIAANMVGKLVAYQDLRVTTVEQAMAVVDENMRLGNEQVVALVANTVGNA